MRGVTRTEKFSPDAAWLWYVTALAGLLLFCFAVSPAAGLPAVSPLAGSPHTVGTTAIPDADTAVFLMQGDRGEEVVRLQKHLTALGYDVGDCTGVYTVKTASAVRRFQIDCGFVGDGICSSETAHAAAYLAGSDVPQVSEDAVWEALAAADCIVEADDDAPRADRLRNALILFQRTHGLCGTGTADFAVLCALGIMDRDLLPSGTPLSEAEAAMFDLRCRLLCGALAEFVSRYPEAYDLYTLTSCAAVLCARTEDVRFPGGFDTVCRLGLLPDDVREQTSAAGSEPERDPLLLLAAEDALTAFLAGECGNRTGGALYVFPAEETIPQDAEVCHRTRHFVFCR